MRRPRKAKPSSRRLRNRLEAVAAASSLMSERERRCTMNPTPFQSGSSAAPVAPAVPTSDAEIEHLSALFASEPELIEASLESPGSDQKRDARRVLAAARQALERRPGYADLHYFAARAALRANEPQQARTLLEAALRINPRYNAAMILAARACVLQGAHAEALRYLRQAVLNGADYTDVHLMVGDLWRQQGGAPPAQEACGRAPEMGSHSATAHQTVDRPSAPQARGGSDELPA